MGCDLYHYYASLACARTLNRVARQIHRVTPISDQSSHNSGGLALRLIDPRKTPTIGGTITFKQAFVCGLLTTVVVALLAPPSQWLTFKFITPHFFENAINYSVAHGQKLADAQAFFNTQNYLRVGIVGALVMGAITSLILAALMRTKKAG